MKTTLKILYIFLCAFLIGSVLGIFKIKDKDAFQAWSGFYAEPYDSLDAVFIGASNVYPFWNASLSFNEHGHVVYPLSISAMPARAYKYMIEEALKKQPSATYILCLNSFKDPDNINPLSIHYISDYMRLSNTKVKMINDLCDVMDTSLKDRLEYFMPFIRFNSRWDELTTDDYILKNDNSKNAMNELYGLYNIKDISSSYVNTENRISITDSQTEVLNDLLDFIEKKDLKALFVIVPQALKNDAVKAQLNSMKDIIENRGFDVVDLIDKYSEIGLDLKSDFYNENHVNVHGAIKFTNYLGNIFQNNYDFENKKDNKEYSSWVNSYFDWLNTVNPYVFDFELANTSRDYSLQAPSVSVSAIRKGINVKWNPVEDADGYAIYKRYRNEDGTFTNWVQLSNVESDTTIYNDQETKRGIDCYYTVVGFSYNGNNKEYGNLDYTGKNVTWYFDAPVLKSLDEVPGGLVLTWEPVKDAEGYNVYRKINGHNWVGITTNVGVNNTSYKDEYYQENVPYVYTVRAYYFDDNSKKQLGTYDSNGLLYNKSGLQSPLLTISKDTDNYILKWEDSEGANYYNLYSRVSDGEWTILKEKIGLNQLEYILDQNKNGSVEYRVSAVISWNNNISEYYSNSVSLDDYQGE